MSDFKYKIVSVFGLKLGRFGRVYINIIKRCNKNQMPKRVSWAWCLYNQRTQIYLTFPS